MHYDDVVAFDSLSLLLHVHSSLITFILWLQFAHRQKRQADDRVGQEPRIPAPSETRWVSSGSET